MSVFIKEIYCFVCVFIYFIFFTPFISVIPSQNPYNESKWARPGYGVITLIKPNGLWWSILLSYGTGRLV